jgi:hypothetical protein
LMRSCRTSRRGARPQLGSLDFVDVTEARHLSWVPGGVVDGFRLWTGR